MALQLPCIIISLTLRFIGGQAASLRGVPNHGNDNLVAWKPPPTYSIDTENHKTMYLADVSVGSAGQVFRLLIDTGSSMLVLPGDACHSRSCMAHKRLHVNKSSGPGQAVSIQFGKGSVRGQTVTERVCVDHLQRRSSLALPLHEVSLLQERSRARHSRLDLAQEQVCTDMSLVVLVEESDEFEGEPFDGILGLGLDDGMVDSHFSLLSQLRSADQISSNRFMLRLKNAGGSELSFGAIDEGSIEMDRVLWVPLSSFSKGYWQFSVTDLVIEGEPEGFGGLEVAVDSGTSLLAADDDVQTWLRVKLQPKDCASVDQLPKLLLRLRDGSALPLLPSDFIDQEHGECRLALMPSSFRSANMQRLVLGDSFLRRYVTIFEPENRRLGFGIVAGDTSAQDMASLMFPTPTTTLQALVKPDEPPPPLHMEYQPFAVSTEAPTMAPAAARDNKELSIAFGTDDLIEDFDVAVSDEKKRVAKRQ